MVRFTQFETLPKIPEKG